MVLNSTHVSTPIENWTLPRPDSTAPCNTSKRFRRACKTLGLRQSAGRTGSCLDNAAAESLFASFKVEQVHRDGLYATKADARIAATRWLVRYNHRRRHSSIDYRTPIEHEQLLIEQRARVATSPRQAA